MDRSLSLPLTRHYPTDWVLARPGRPAACILPWGASINDIHYPRGRGGQRMTRGGVILAAWTDPIADERAGCTSSVRRAFASPAAKDHVQRWAKKWFLGSENCLPDSAWLLLSKTGPLFSHLCMYIWYLHCHWEEGTQKSRREYKDEIYSLLMLSTVWWFISLNRG